MLLVLSGMASIASLLSLWARTILPLSRGNLMTASSHVRLMVVTPWTLGLRFNIRLGSAQTSVMHACKAAAVLLTSTSNWVKTVEPLLMSTWWSGRELKKDWSKWDGPFSRKDSGWVDVLPHLITSNRACPPARLARRWSSSACICGGERVIISIWKWSMKPAIVLGSYLGLHEPLLDGHLKITPEHFHKLLHVKGDISVGKVHLHSPPSLAFSTFCFRLNMTIKMAYDWHHPGWRVPVKQLQNSGYEPVDFALTLGDYSNDLVRSELLWFVLEILIPGVPWTRRVGWPWNDLNILNQTLRSCGSSTLVGEPSRWP